MGIPSGSSKSFDDHAIVLRVQKLGDTDKIVIFLTEHHGVIHAVAKGARKTTSKFGGRLEPFMLLNISLTAGKNLYTLTQAQTVRAYTAPIMGDYFAYIVGLSLVELIEQLANFEVEGTGGTTFNRLAGGLSSLSRGTHQPLDILNAFYLRSLASAGWGLLPYRCVACGQEVSLRWFSAQEGLLCENCGRLECNSVSLPVSLETVEYMKIVLKGDWSKFEKSQSQVPAQQAFRMISAFTTWQLEKNLKALALIEREI